jgi:ATF/CREB family transcription factor
METNFHHEDPASIKQDDSIKADLATTKAEPLAPPPRPEPTSNPPDYFSGSHAPTHPLTTEPNPFESSFAGGGGYTTNANGEVQTPGGTKLPSVAALTSPANFQSGTPGFWSSLRSGPLSPAMLSGPQKAAAEDYFTDGHHLRGGFPTPNESGLRSGLTPGGSGSMFPEPSPGIFGHLASGVATPATLDFHRTAVNAAAAHREAPPNVTSQPQELLNGMQDVKPPQGQFDQHEANDAANGLFLLANARNSNTQQPAHYAMAPQMSVHGHPQPAMNIGGHPDSSPQMSNQHNGSISTTSGRGVSEISDENDQQSRPNTRGKGKRSSTQITQSNGRRKTEETPSKAPAGKKAKANNGHAMEPEPQSEEELDMNKDEYNANGKKMTDEEKRKNFLERNRYVQSSLYSDLMLTIV